MTFLKNKSNGAGGDENLKINFIWPKTSGPFCPQGKNIRVKSSDKSGDHMLNNKRPMGHIAHLSNTGSYENTFRILIYISFPFAPPDPQGP
jgi:hypothetical protein